MHAHQIVRMHFLFLTTSSPICQLHWRWNTSGFSQSLQLSRISRSAFKKCHFKTWTFKPAVWQLRHTAAMSVHIYIAKSSSIILHYLSLESSCLSQLSPQRDFLFIYFPTCQSPFQRSVHVLTDGTLENTSGESLLRQLKSTIFITTQYLVSKLHRSTA